MRPPAVKLGPVMWALCACLLLLPHAAAAGEPVLASDTTLVLVSHPPLHQIAAIDLVGQDREPEEDLSGGDVGLSAERTSLQVPPDDGSSARVPQRESPYPASPASRPFSPRPPPA